MQYCHNKVYFRKAGYVCGINEKGHILVRLGQTPQNSMQKVFRV